MTLAETLEPEGAHLSVQQLVDALVYKLKRNDQFVLSIKIGKAMD